MGRVVVIFDTAGRLAVDNELMRELEEIKEKTRPGNILFVCDAMIGQDAVRTAAEFDRRLGFTGFVLTKLDGDARGGAALSIKALLVSAEEAHYPVPVPTLALSGERDGCIASDVFERLTVAGDFPQGVRFHRVSSAGHFLHQEKPEVVNPLLLDWLNERAHHR